MTMLVILAVLVALTLAATITVSAAVLADIRAERAALMCQPRGQVYRSRTARRRPGPGARRRARVVRRSL